MPITSKRACSLCVDRICAREVLQPPEKHEKLARLKIVKEAFPDGECVHRQGEIGETKRFHNRAKDHNSESSHKGMVNDICMVNYKNSFSFEGSLGEVLTFLKKYDDETQGDQFQSWVHLWPILSDVRMHVS